MAIMRLFLTLLFALAFVAIATPAVDRDETALDLSHGAAIRTRPLILGSRKIMGLDTGDDQDENEDDEASNDDEDDNEDDDDDIK